MVVLIDQKLDVPLLLQELIERYGPQGPQGFPYDLTEIEAEELLAEVLQRRRTRRLFGEEDDPPLTKDEIW